MSHLWEAEHPYHAAEGCYYSNGCAHSSSSWLAFAAEADGWDLDLNHVWRWDWNIDEEDGSHTLTLYCMAQRKAMPYSFEIAVTEEDEPLVMAFLQRHWEVTQTMWAPFHADSGATATAMADEWRRARIAKLRAELSALEVSS